MKNSNILRWIIFIPVAIASIFVTKFIEGYSTDLADYYDNFIVKWIIAIAYSFFHPIIIVAVGVEIVPKYKSIVSKFMSVLLLIMFCYIIYLTSIKSGSFLQYLSYTISILGCIVAFITVGQEEGKYKR